MTAQLSIIIPTFKRTDSLERLLDHLNDQKEVSLQIIVVDQNEPGYFTGALLKKVESVKWVKQPVPNASTARNNGFEHSTAAFVLFLDDDLVPEPEFCKQGLAIFSQYPDIKCFVPLVYSHLGKELALTYGRNKYLTAHALNPKIFSITETISAAVFFERSYYEKAGGFDVLLFEFAKTSEDQEFFLRMLHKNMQLWVVPFMEIFHDEKVGGGCELRTAGYWNTRTKCMRAIALRHRIHKKQPGRLSVSDIVQLARSSFFNKQALTSGFANFASEIRLMNSSIRESKSFFALHKIKYQAENVTFIHSHPA